MSMRSLCFLIGSVLLVSGCGDRSEVPVSAYGVILEEFPVLEAADEPFPFPMEGDNDHQNCEFKKEDFM